MTSEFVGFSYRATIRYCKWLLFLETMRLTEKGVRILGHVLLRNIKAQEDNYCWFKQNLDSADVCVLTEPLRKVYETLPNFGWPATYLSERSYEARPTFDLLLLAVFSHDLPVGEYWCRERPRKIDGRSFQQGTDNLTSSDK